MSLCLTLSLREAAHSGSGVLAMGQEAAVILIIFQIKT